MNWFVTLRLGALTCLALLVSPSAMAWDALDSCGGGSYTAWAPGSPATVWKYASSLPSDDFSVAETLQILNDSFDEWAMPGCSSFSVQQGPDTSADPMDYNSDRAVGFYEDYFPYSLGSALAVTFMSWDWDCEMSDASMVFNGADFSWVAGDWGNDLQSVATHEAGHWVGLDNSGASASTMTAYYTGGIGDRVLNCDDTEAICTLYPSGGTACGAPGGSDYCPCGQTCQDGWCQGSASGDPWDTGDDDVVSDDDDDTEEVPEGCVGPPENYAEAEPNDGNGVHDLVQGAGGDVRIEAEIWCANDGDQWSGDYDWFHLEVPCADQARFTVTWGGGTSDLDFWVYDEEHDLIVENEDEDYAGPVTEEGFVDGGLYFGVACWSGPSLSYTIEVDFFPWGWSEPEGEGSTADDDDSAPSDDDDSAGTDGSGSGGDPGGWPQAAAGNEEGEGTSGGCSCEAAASPLEPSWLIVVLCGLLWRRSCWGDVRRPRGPF